MTDTELLREYVATASQAAFGELVARHIDLVYAAARRQTRDAALAEDVTQAVFIVLARKAAKVHDGAALPAWLITTARYAASNARSAAIRRRSHEQRAAAMRNESSDVPGVATESQVGGDDDSVSPLLDDALARLGRNDRSAVAMRFLQGKSLREVAQTMGISEQAAQKRVTRAVGRLRDSFARRGITLESAELVGNLARQHAQVAPPVLAALVATKALSTAAAGAAGASTAGAAIAKAATDAMAWAQVKLVSSACAAALVVAAGATGATVAMQHRAAAAAPQQPAAAPVQAVSFTPTKPRPATAPSFLGATLHAEDIWMPYVPSMAAGTEVLKLRNAQFAPGGDGPVYTTQLDATVQRGDEPAMAVHSDAAPPRQASRFYLTIPAAPYHGKRIRLSGYLKSKDVTTAGALELWVFDAKKNALAQDDMGGHPVFGTSDWTRYDIVSDVPEQAAVVHMQVTLRGSGTLWADGLELSVVGKDVPVNDDHRWRSWLLSPAKYQTTLDGDVRRNGRPTICIRSVTDTGPNAPVAGDWVTYDHTELDVTPFLGKRVKFTAMIKCEDVTGSGGPVIRAVGPANSTLKLDEQRFRRPLKGTLDWHTYTTYLTVPKEAADLSAGVTLMGGGKVWFDDLRMEIVPPEK